MSDRRLEHLWMATVNQRTPKGFTDWHCRRCDSIVRFPDTFKASDIHARMRAVGYLCIPPLPHLDKLNPTLKKSKKVNL